MREDIKKYFEQGRIKTKEWYDNTVAAKAEAADAKKEAKEYLKKKENPTAEDVAVYKEAKATYDEAHEQSIFYDGVMQGFEMAARNVIDRMAREELANAGRWVPKPFKPRRR